MAIYRRCCLWWNTRGTSILALVSLPFGDCPHRHWNKLIEFFADVSTRCSSHHQGRVKLKVSSSRLGVVTNIVFFLQWAHSCLSSLLHNHEFVWYSIFTKSTKVDGSPREPALPQGGWGQTECIHICGNCINYWCQLELKTFDQPYRES